MSVIKSEDWQVGKSTEALLQQTRCSLKEACIPKIKKKSVGSKKISALKNIRKSKQKGTKENKNAEEEAAMVRKNLQLKIAALRAKKKPNFKFSCSPPEVDAQNISETSSIAHSSSVADGRVLKEKCTNVLEIGDSGLVIVDVIGGYESSDEGEISYQLSGNGASNRSNLSKETSNPKMIEHNKKLTDKRQVFQNSNENAFVFNKHQLLQDNTSDKSNQRKTTSKLKICDKIVESLKREKKEDNSTTISTIATPLYDIPDLPPVCSNNASGDSTTVLLNTFSTVDASLKPYKYRTRGEKRRLLEASRLPLMYFMYKKQCQENQARILSYRNQLACNKVPYGPETYDANSDITNTYNYIVNKGKRFLAASGKTDEVLANTEKRKAMSKISPHKIGNIKKPPLLISLKEEPQAVEGETEKVKLPKESLLVVPQHGHAILHPKVEHFVESESWDLSENRVKFDLSLLKANNVESKLDTFKFPLFYADNPEMMKMNRKFSEDNVTDSDDEIQQGVKSVMDKLLNYVDVLDETKYLHMNYENVENRTEEPILTVSKVGRPKKRRYRPRSKINKISLELKRLNCQIVSIEDDETNSDNEKCIKEVCKLGCICKTLRCDSKNILPTHCGLWQCILECSCKTNSITDDTSFRVGDNFLNAGAINRLQNQAKKNLAKVEKEFTQTIIKSNNHLIMIESPRQRRHRE